MNFSRPIGLHIRTNGAFCSIIKQAKKYKLRNFQFFLTEPSSQQYLKITDKDLQDFRLFKQQYSTGTYIHTSYWINPSSGNSKNLQLSTKLIKKEIRSAKKLQVKNLIMHAGCAKGHRSTSSDPAGKILGISTLAKLLNNILKENLEIQILLENTAHANQTIGSDFRDFFLLTQMLENPAKLNFCLDLAHAFVYGYDLQKIDDFLQLLDQNLGLKKIKLIHLSDTTAPFASRIDKHEIPGKGIIGKEVLSNIINHPELRKIPIIVELPATIKTRDIIKTLEDIKSW